LGVPTRQLQGRQKMTTADDCFGLAFIVDVLIDKQRLLKDEEKIQCWSG
jgi:hypothetical protein